MQRYILGVDIGTGSTKAVAMDFEGRVLAAVNHHYPTSQPEAGFSEQNPEHIWQAFLQCITDITSRLSAQPEMVSLSSAMHSIIPVDAKGYALMPMITWADTRSESIATELRKTAGAEKIYRRTGTPIHPMSPLCKLIWMRRERPDIMSSAFKFLSIKDFIWFRLFGYFETDYSLASASGLFDICDLSWSEEAFSLAGITREHLPEPKNTDFIRLLTDIHLTKQLGFRSDTPFLIGASDGCCANLGSQVNERGKAALTIGTSGAIRVTSTSPIYNYEAMIFNYLLDEHTYISGGAINNGGNIVKWLLHKFLNISEITETTYAQLFNSIDGIRAGSEGLLFLPYLYGERAPIWNAEASGAYLNIGPQHSQTHFLRAGLEGICFALNDVLKHIEVASGPIDYLHISGGFTSSETWIQMLADITGKQLYLMQTEDASAIGAIYLAMRKSYPDDYLQVITTGPGREILPNQGKHEKYQSVFLIYSKLYEALKSSMELFQRVN